MAEGDLPPAGRGALRSSEARLGTPWVLRWDTAADREPCVQHVPGTPGDATACRTAAGDLVVLDGHLLDRGAREPGGPASGAARVATAARHAGSEDLLAALGGAFAVLIWDAARRRLVVGRDVMGLVPCFYWWNGRVLLASVSLDAMLACPEVAPAFDRAVVAEFLQNRMSSHQVHETFYRDVRRLPAAHALRVERGRLELSRYWDPVPPGFAWATRDEMSRFDSLLEQAVDRCLEAGADSVALSGGFDSV